jgi:3-phenylpropionate/trans-cinnamate dioxygenase ferredoxin subunit
MNKQSKDELDWKLLVDYEMNPVPFLSEGGLTLQEISGKKICLGRNHQGYFAIDDQCPHAYGSLSKGFCNDKREVVCPLHRIPFNTETGKSMETTGYTVYVYPVKEDEKGIWIGMKKKRFFWF